jgi:hypothetical protein
MGLPVPASHERDKSASLRSQGVDVKNSFASVTYALPHDHVASILGNPSRDTSPADDFRGRLEDLVCRHIDGAPGFLVLTGLGHLSLAEAEAFTISASRIVGRLLPQDAKGTVLRQVVDRGVRLGEGKTGRYSDSRQGGNLHTDGPHVPPPVPDCFALYCVHQARVGGELCLIHVDELINGLPAWVTEVLRSDFHFDRRDADVEDPTVVRPVLRRTPAGTRVCYLREYIEIGHRRDDVPSLTVEQREAMNLFDALLNDPDRQVRGRLQPGDMAFFNNRVLLHGRTEFQDDPDSNRKRLMFRTWIHRPT